VPKALSVSKWLGYSVAGVTFTAGVAVLAELIDLGYAPAQLRVTLGVVLVLLGIYRFVITRTKASEAQSHDEQ
jgi:hypothetical protein